MEAKEIYNLALAFDEKVDYRIRLYKPESWAEWFNNETNFLATENDYLVFCILTRYFLMSSKALDIEFAFIIGWESDVLRRQSKK